MAIDNTHFYGFRWSESYNNSAMPKVLWGPVASGYNGSISGGSAIDINVGDPIVGLSTGYLAHAAGSETTAVAALGIVVAIGPVWDGTLMQRVNKVANSSGVYGSNYEHRTQIGYVPIDQGYWEIDADDATTATTFAAWLALRGENANHVLRTGAEPKADPLLDISTHNTTNTLLWRIIDISNTMANKDLAGNYVKVIVKANVAQMSWSSATGV